MTESKDKDSLEGGNLLDLERLRFDERGLLPVVAQDVLSGTVLMLAWANREAIELTLERRWAHFFSRSRQELWLKGETSGNRLQVVEVLADCDSDAVLYRVVPTGPACHRGTRSCFPPSEPQLELGWLAAVLRSRGKSPAAESYTARLLADGRGRIAQKVGEEATEVVVAALDEPERLAEETADLLYHLLLLLQVSEVSLDAVAAELGRRHGWVAASGEAP